jgi:NAD(P)H dehydrogenase (quinone)
MFVVAGVTGHTGRAVADTVLARSKPVRVLVRNQKNAAAWRARGAEAALVSLDDAGRLARAFSGASGAYVLIPPQYAAEDLLAAQRSVADAIAEAVKTSGIPNVVLLSSLGAQHAEGTGPIRSLHYAEGVIGNAGKNITIVRAAYFLENWEGVLGEARKNGVLLSFLTPGRPVPMVATRDIGRAAAEALLEPARGTRIIELLGPQDWTPEDVARALGQLLGRDVRVQGLPLEAVEPAFVSTGMSPATARLVREMIEGVNAGRVAPEGGPALLRRGALGPADVFATALSQATA